MECLNAILVSTTVMDRAAESLMRAMTMDALLDTHEHVTRRAYPFFIFPHDRACRLLDLVLALSVFVGVHLLRVVMYAPEMME
jgi:hypothetical protein